MMRSLISKILFVPQLIMIGIFAFHMYLEYVNGADGFRLFLVFLAYFIPVNLLQIIRMRIRDPYNPRWYKPKTAKPRNPEPVKPMPSAKVAKQETVPVAPKAAQEPRTRRFAAPPLVKPTQSNKDTVPSSMSHGLHQFVAKGQAAISSISKDR